MRRIVVLTLVAACSGQSGKDSPADDAGGSGGTTDTGTPPDNEDTAPPEDTSASLSGTVSSPGGPLGGVDLRLCRGLACRNATSDAQGAYTYSDVAVDWFSFEVVPPEGTAYATVFAPLEFHTDEGRVVDPVLLAHDPASSLGSAPAEHAVGDGLFVTLAEGDLTPPLLAERATEVAGVSVPEADRVPTDGIAGTVLGMWYVEPFNHRAAAPAGIPARFEDRWGLADGTVLEVYVGSYDDSAWLPAGTATASGGQLVGAALPLLSTVILVQP